MDLSLSAVGLFFSLPLFALIALLIKLGGPGPVFFRQERVGLHGRRFKIWKFRTMVVGSSVGSLLTVGRDPRITAVGRWLRRVHLDELPQLFNVLAGDMSLVGPRPEVPRYVEHYTREQRAVLDLMPGITDPASIEFRGEGDLLSRAADPERLYIETVMQEKIRKNLQYARSASVWSDVRILLNTMVMVAL